jgi:hypothetical protein
MPTPHDRPPMHGWAVRPHAHALWFVLALLALLLVLLVTPRRTGSEAPRHFGGPSRSSLPVSSR